MPMTLFDANGRPVDRNPNARVSRLLGGTAPIFEGVLSVTRYDDAIEGKGRCFHCKGEVGGVLRFDPKLVLEQNISDGEIRKALYDMLQAKHQCGARLFDGKDTYADFLKRIGEKA